MRRGLTAGWFCLVLASTAAAQDQRNAGTVTSVGCGTGLTGGTITNTGTCASDFTVLGGLGQNNTWGGANTFSSTITGTGVVGMLAAPGGIGGITPGAGAFTGLTLTGGVTLAGNPLSALGNVTSNVTTAFRLTNATPTATAPSIVTNRSDTTTGLGGVSGSADLIAGGTNMVHTTSSLVSLPTIGTDATHTDASVCEDTTTHALYSGSGTLGICLGTSSARFKSEIKALAPGLAEIMALKPVSYRLDAQHGDPTKLYYGFTAEQGGDVLPVLMTRDNAGLPNAFDYLGVVPVLVRAIQEQQREIAALKRMIP